MYDNIARRESDGKFALKLQSRQACQRREEKERQDAQRAAEVKVQYAEWCKSVGMDPEEADTLFA